VAFVSSGLRSGAFRPVVDRTFTLDEIVEAHRYLEANTHTGKVVVTPAR
jgi:NADPH:quinone reductase-like Zn-dependent oxidoreductase